MTLTVRVSKELEDKIRVKSEEDLTSMTSVINSIITNYFNFEQMAEKFGLHHISPEIVSMYHDPFFIQEVLSGGKMSQKYLDVLANFPEKFYVGTIGDAKSQTAKAKKIRRTEAVRVIELIMAHMKTEFKKREVGNPLAEEVETIFTITHGMGLTYSHALNFMFGEFLKVHDLSSTFDLSATNLILKIEK